MRLQSSGFTVGKRMSSAPPVIIDSYPLWYGDTGTIVNPPYGPDEPVIPPGGNEPEAVNDSIYAYVFDFANMEGSVVIGVDEALPDLLVYSRGCHFLKGPRFTQSQGSQEEQDRRWKEWLKEMQEWIQQCDKELRKELRDLAVLYKESLEQGVDKYRKQIALWTAGDLTIPELVRRDVVKDWHVTRGATYKGGMSYAPWYNMSPFTDELIRNYGPEINCWDIIPTLARYLSVVKPSASYKGWPLKWDEWLSLTKGGKTPEQQNQILDEIGHLYNILGLSENLDVNYQTEQPMEVINNISRTLSNFGMTRTGSIEKEYVVLPMMDEIDNNHPCIAMCESEVISSVINRPGICSILIDEYEIKQINVVDVFSDNVSVPRSFSEYFFSMKFSDLHVNGGEVFWNWALFEPSASYKFQRMKYCRLPLPLPSLKPNYKKFWVLKEIGFDPDNPNWTKRK